MTGLCSRAFGRLNKHGGKCSCAGQWQTNGLGAFPQHPRRNQPGKAQSCGNAYEMERAQGQLPDSGAGAEGRMKVTVFNAEWRGARPRLCPAACMIRACGGRLEA